MAVPIYQQARRVSFGNLVAEHMGDGSGIDMNISVRSKKEGIQFTVGLWNLADSSWNSIKKKDELRIELGWLETGLDPVCLGRIESTRTKYHNSGADTEHIIEGVDISSEYMSYRPSHTYSALTDPGIIAVDLANRAGGVSPALVERVGGAMPQNFPVKDDHPTRYWLNQVVKEAEKLTEEQWTWDVQAGKFYFHRMATPRNIQTSLSSDEGGLLHHAEKSTGNSTQDGSEEVSFAAYIDPLIQKNAIVDLSSRQFTGRYKVAEYEYVSDTVSGDHRVEGTLVPERSAYTAPLPGHPTMEQKLMAKKGQLDDGMESGETGSGV